MTKEELVRFALVLREAERASAEDHDGEDPSSAKPEHSFGPVMAAA